MCCACVYVCMYDRQTEVATWVEAVMEPLVPELDAASFQGLSSRSKPMAIGVVDPSRSDETESCVRRQRW